MFWESVGVALASLAAWVLLFWLFRTMRRWRAKSAEVVSDRRALTLVNGVEVREVVRVNGKVEYVLTETRRVTEGGATREVVHDVSLSYEAADTLVWFLQMRFGKLPNPIDGSYR